MSTGKESEVSKMPRLTKRDKFGKIVIIGATEENKEELTARAMERLAVYEETILPMKSRKFIEMGNNGKIQN